MPIIETLHIRRRFDRDGFDLQSDVSPNSDILSGESDDVYDFAEEEVAGVVIAKRISDDDANTLAERRVASFDVVFNLGWSDR